MRIDKNIRYKEMQPGEYVSGKVSEQKVYNDTETVRIMVFARG